MKKIILILVVLAIVNPSFAQKITKESKDEFTGEVLRQTSYQEIFMNINGTAYIAFKSIDNTRYIALKLMTDGGIITIGSDDEVMLKLENDEIIKGQSIGFQKSCGGCGAKGFIGSMAEGINAKFLISQEDFNKLIKYKIKVIRIYTTDGYVESKIPSRKAEKVINVAKLLSN